MAKGCDEQGRPRKRFPFPFEGLGGTVHGSFFEAPLYVDLRNKPGHTSLEAVVNTDGRLEWYNNFFNPISYIYTPNLVWCLMSLGLYFAFPYSELIESEEAKHFHWSLIWKRMMLHTVVMLIYVGFWHVACYVWKFSKRAFDQKVEGPSKSRLFHNIYWSILGSLQSGLWDAFFIHIYANRIVPFTPDSEAFSLSWSGAALTFTLVAVGAQWRDVHFFFAHKLIHMRFIYKYVHSLHHRNVQIEPFSGLCMHPVEHMYYYSCAGAMLLLGASPFIPFWVLMHALLAPAASHSGFEDIWQSDLFHTIHHYKFECNYGAAALPLDFLSGTFRETLGEKSSVYKGAWEEKDSAAAALFDKGVGIAEGESKAYLRGSLTLVGALYKDWQQALYDFCTCIMIPYFAFTAFQERAATLAHPIPSSLAAAVVTFGPPLFGLLFQRVFDGFQSWRWPFHKESVSKVSFFILVATVLVLLPVYVTVYCGLEASTAAHAGGVQGQ